MRKSTLKTLMFGCSLSLAAGLAHAVVPSVEKAGLPATAICGIGPTGQQLVVRNFDKIIFLIRCDAQPGAAPCLIAQNPNEQPQLNAVPTNTPLDIKVLDNPRQVADIKSKVLTFLGAAVTATNRNRLQIVDVDYTAVCALPTTLIPAEQ